MNAAHPMRAAIRTSAIAKLLLASTLFLAGDCVHAADVPPLKGRVNDYAAILSPRAIELIEADLAALEKTDSTQVAVLTVNSLEGDTIEEFAIKVAGAWKIGQRGKDNGVLFVVAMKERRLRIEVGYGLEGRLTDLVAGRIIDLVIKPEFKAGRYEAGVQKGVAAIIDAVRGEFRADSLPGNRESDDSSSLFYIIAVVLILFLGSIRRILGGIAGAVAAPLLFGGAVMKGIAGMLLMIPLGFLAGLIIPALFRSGGGFLPGSLGGGGFSSDNGGWSGGGGGFGGGGASGSW